MSVKWSRLVRYVSSDGSIKYGEPVTTGESSSEIEALLKTDNFAVRVFEGASALDAVPTGATETVERLLGPLSQQEVPIIRCIGLNYKAHSK
jgi:hypothetical protein